MKTSKPKAPTCKNIHDIKVGSIDSRVQYEVDTTRRLYGRGGEHTIVKKRATAPEPVYDQEAKNTLVILAVLSS